MFLHSINATGSKLYWDFNLVFGRNIDAQIFSEKRDTFRFEPEYLLRFSVCMGPGLQQTCQKLASVLSTPASPLPSLFVYLIFPVCFLMLLFFITDPFFLASPLSVLFIMSLFLSPQDLPNVCLFRKLSASRSFAFANLQIPPGYQCKIFRWLGDDSHSLRKNEITHKVSFVFQLYEWVRVCFGLSILVSSFHYFKL